MLMEINVFLCIKNLTRVYGSAWRMEGIVLSSYYGYGLNHIGALLFVMHIASFLLFE